VVKTAESLSTIISTLNHHYAEPVPIIDKIHIPKVTTLQGIHSFHKFTFPSCNVHTFFCILLTMVLGGKILAYLKSTDTTGATPFETTNDLNDLYTNLPKQV
jgi:hypothetical protein